MIYKYKTFQDAQTHLDELLPKDPLEVLSRTWELAEGLHSRKNVQRGILKFKTIQEANKHKETSN